MAYETIAENHIGHGFEVIGYDHPAVQVPHGVFSASTCGCARDLKFGWLLKPMLKTTLLMFLNRLDVIILVYHGVLQVHGVKLEI